jgi:hypothetical protein
MVDGDLEEKTRISQLQKRQREGENTAPGGRVTVWACGGDAARVRVSPGP